MPQKERKPPRRAPSESSEVEEQPPPVRAPWRDPRASSEESCAHLGATSEESDTGPLPAVVARPRRLTPPPPAPSRGPPSHLGGHLVTVNVSRPNPLLGRTPSASPRSSAGTPVPAERSPTPPAARGWGTPEAGWPPRGGGRAAEVPGDAGSRSPCRPNPLLAGASPARAAAALPGGPGRGGAGAGTALLLPSPSQSTPSPSPFSRGSPAVARSPARLPLATPSPNPLLSRAAHLDGGIVEAQHVPEDLGQSRCQAPRESARPGRRPSAGADVVALEERRGARALRRPAAELLAGRPAELPAEQRPLPVAAAQRRREGAAVAAAAARPELEPAEFLQALVAGAPPRGGGGGAAGRPPSPAPRAGTAAPPPPPWGSPKAARRAGAGPPRRREGRESGEAREAEGEGRGGAARTAAKGGKVRRVGGSKRSKARPEQLPGPAEEPPAEKALPRPKPVVLPAAPAGLDDAMAEPAPRLLGRRRVDLELKCQCLASWDSSEQCRGAPAARRGRWSPRTARSAASTPSQESAPSFGVAADVEPDVDQSVMAGSTATTMDLSFGRGCRAGGFATTPTAPGARQEVEAALCEASVEERGWGGHGAAGSTTAGAAVKTAHPWLLEEEGKAQACCGASTRSSSPAEGSCCVDGLNVTFGRGGLAASLCVQDDLVEAVSNSFAAAAASFIPVVRGKVVNDGLESGLRNSLAMDLKAGVAKPRALGTSLARRAALVRLPRAQEWMAENPRAPPGARPVLLEWTRAAQQVRLQRVLSGGWVDTAALARWYMPYLTVGILYTLTVMVAEFEVLLLHMPLFLGLWTWNQARLARWDGLLLAVVDACTLEEVRKQFHAPLGWGEGGSLFAAHLNAALQGVRAAPNGLLLARPAQSLARLPFACLATLLILLSALRAVRASSARGGDSLLRNAGPVAEGGGAAVVLLLFVLVCCSHTQGRPRTSLADLRIEVLEAAFNALLDVLRPLVGPGAGAGERSCGTLRPGGAGGAARKPSSFCVRLLTAERQTLRASISLSLTGEPSLLVACPLADFSLSAAGAENATRTDLGGSSATFDVEGPHRGPPSSGAAPWTAVLLARFGSGEQPHCRQEDDVLSATLSNTSTANRVSARGGDQVDEVALHLAMAMVAAICSRRCEPLEAFRSVMACGSGSILPPKATVEEPCLVLALARQKLHFSGGRGPRAAEAVAASPWRCHCCLASSKGAVRCKDTLGVLRDAAQLQKLLKGTAGLHSRGAAAEGEECPRSSFASGSTAAVTAEEERGGRPARLQPQQQLPGAAEFAGLATCLHLVLLFDSCSERDDCLAVLRSSRLLPDGVGPGQP